MVAVVLTLVAGPLAAAVAAPEQRLEAAVLDALGLKPDTADLLAFVSARTPEPLTEARVAELVGRLAAEDFRDREAAQAALIKGGSAVAPALRTAQPKAGPEQARRIGEVLRQIEADWLPKGVAAYRAAVRAVARRAPDGAVPVLLRTLPLLAEDDELLAAAWHAIDAATVKAGVIPPTCLAAKTDPESGRRAVAAFLLGRRGTEAQRREATGLLKDPDPSVRLRAAQGLLGSDDYAGVPTLIGLLEARPITIAWEAEELLSWLAGGDAPPLLVADPEAGKYVRRSWERWWARTGPGFDRKAAENPRRPILFLLRDLIEFANRPSVLLGSDGRERWVASYPTERMIVERLLPTGRAIGLAWPSPDTRLLTEWSPAPAYAEIEPPARGVRRGNDLKLSGRDEFLVRRWAGGWTLIAGAKRFGFVTPGGSDVRAWTSVPDATKRTEETGRPARDILIGEQEGVLWYRCKDFQAATENVFGLEAATAAVVDRNPTAGALPRPDRCRFGDGVCVETEDYQDWVRVVEPGGRCWKVTVRRGRPVVAAVLPLVRMGFGHHP